MRSKRILIVLPNDTLGGAEQVLKQVAMHYFRKDYTVDVFFLKKKNDGNWENIGTAVNLYYTTFNREKYGLFSMLVNLWKHGSRNEYELAFTSHIHISGLVGVLKRLGILNIKKFIARESTTIFDRFSGWRLKRAKFIYKIGYRSIDLLICQTNYMKEQLYRGMPSFFINLKKIEVIPNPISLGDIRADNFAGSPYHNTYIISAGRLIFEKGYDILIKSFKAISLKYQHLDLIIIGEGNMRPELERLIDQLDLNTRVLMPGFKRNVYSYFRYAELCVVSSRIEGFPNVLLQMMSQNNKVISTLCAGGIEDIEGICTCPPDNIEQLAASIEATLNLDCQNNSLIFNLQLQDRDITHFINKIHHYVGLDEVPIPDNAVN